MRKFTVLFLLILFLLDSGIALGQCKYHVYTNIKDSVTNDSVLPTRFFLYVTICSGTEVIFRVDSSTVFNGKYQWYYGYTLVNDTTATYINSSLNNNDVIYCRFNCSGGGGGHSNSDTIKMVVKTLPGVQASANPTQYCFGSGGSSTIAASGGNTYTWSPSTDLSATTGSSVTANPTATNTYAYIVTGTDTSTGCTNTATAVVTVNPTPTVTVTTPSPICNGTSTTLIVTGTATSYTWAPSTGLNQTTGSSVTAGPSATTTYTITGTLGSGINSCTATKTVVVTVNPKPVVTATSDTICKGQQGVLMANGANTYSWSPSTGLSATTGASVTVDNVTLTTTYTVIGTNTYGCTDTTTAVLKVNTLPTISVAPATICYGNSTVLTASGATSYTWKPATGLSVTTGSTVTANPTVTTKYTIIGTSGTDCVDSTTTTVTVDTLPVVTATSSPTAICLGQETSKLKASGAGSSGNSYTWSPSTGLSATTGSSITASPIVTVTYTVTGTNSNSCVNTNTTDTVSVKVNPLPFVTASANPTNYCPGDSSTLTASGATKYTWSPSSDLSATIGNTVVANDSIQTSYTYHVIGTDNNGCIDSGSVSITVDSTALLPDIIPINNDTVFCFGQSATLMVVNPCGGCTYNWSNSSAGQSISVIDSGTYHVSAKNGCSTTGNSNSISIIVNPLPSVEITQLDDSVMPNLKSLSICGNAFGLHYAVNNPIANQQYSWSTGSLKHVTSPNSTICIILDSVIFQPFPDSISLQITDTKTGCENIKTEQIANSGFSIEPSINPIQMFTSSPNIYVCLNNQVTQYQWGSDEGLSMDTPLMPRPFIGETNQSYIGDTVGKYLWVVTITGNCWTRSYYNAPLTRAINGSAKVLNGDMKILPNPSTGSFTLQLSGSGLGNENIKLYNLVGEIIYEGSTIKSTSVQSIPFDFNYLSSGLYFLSINGAIDGTSTISIE